MFTWKAVMMFSGDYEWSCEALINILKNCIEHTRREGTYGSLLFKIRSIQSTVVTAAPGSRRRISPISLTASTRAKMPPPTRSASACRHTRAIVEKQVGIFRQVRRAALGSRLNFTGRLSDAGVFLWSESKC